jgi:LemA protein
MRDQQQDSHWTRRIREAPNRIGDWQLMGLVLAFLLAIVFLPLLAILGPSGLFGPAVSAVRNFMDDIGPRNHLAEDTQRISTTWSQLDSAIDKRASLIPELVRSAGADSVRKDPISTELADACAALQVFRTPAERIAANSRLDVALNNFADSEIYRERLAHALAKNTTQLSKDEETFLLLQGRLERAHQDIGLAQERYNSAIQSYDYFINTFPNNRFRFPPVPKELRPGNSAKS